MATIADVVEQLAEVTKALSDRVRVVGFGIVALCWTLFTTAEGTKLLGRLDRRSMAVALFLAILCVAFDMLQYLCGYFHQLLVLRHMESIGVKQARFKTSHPLYRARRILFHAKLAAAIGAAIAVAFAAYGLVSLELSTVTV